MASFYDPSSYQSVTNPQNGFSSTTPPLYGAEFSGASVLPVAPLPTVTPEQAKLALTKVFNLPGGYKVTADQLAQTDYGSKLLALSQRDTPYGFIDGLFQGSWLDYVPFANTFANVGGSRDNARVVSDAYRKLLAGEPISEEEAIKVQLHQVEDSMKERGSWWYMLGNVLHGAPAFFTEMGLLGKGISAVRSGLVASSATKYSDDAIKFLSKAGVTRATKTGTIETADMFVKSAIESDVAAGVYSSANAAAKAYLQSPEFIKTTTQQVAKGVMGLMEKSAPHVTRIDKWAPGLQEKVAETLAERAVRASLTHAASDAKWTKYFTSASKAVGRSMIEGLTDVGAWGTESASTLMTHVPNASRAFSQAALDLSFGGLARGAALWMPREVIAKGGSWLSEVLGHEAPVRASTLGLQAAAWQNGDETLMSRAETYGMFLELLEYVSESTGRGFNNLARGVGLTVAPKLLSPGAKVAGTLQTRGATQVVRDAASKAITGVNFDAGIVDAAAGAEVGGVMQRFLNKIALGRNIKENVANDALAAVKHKLSDKLKIDLTNVSDASLLATIRAQQLDPALPAHVAQVIGPKVKPFVNAAIKEANAEGLKNLKLHGFMTYYIADFAARHNMDAKRAWEAFRTMGYDGVLAEMAEERYNDVFQTLFELEPDRKEGWEKLTTAVRRAFMPDGGWKQLTAEAIGFAVPMGIRAVVTRSLAALGTPNEYAELNAWAQGTQDALRYGSVQHFERGDYIAKMNAQAARLREAARAATGEDASARDYETAALRAEQLRDEFIASLDPKATSFAAPIYSDADLMQPASEYGRMPHITPEQATEALAGYKNLTSFAAKAGQIQYKYLHRAKDEPRNWFMRASHKLTEYALRIGGSLATGDYSFMSANPAAFAAVERGMNPAFLNTLEKAYGNVYKSVIEEISEVDTRTGLRTADTAKAHDVALQRFQHQAQGLMAQHLAAMHVYMFSQDELRDISLQATAQEDGFLVDPAAREFVKADGTRVSFHDYEQEPGVAARVSSRLEKDAQIVYDLIANASDPDAASMALRSTETEALIRRLVNIPKGMPAADRVVLATVLRYHPAFADTGYADFRNVDTTVRIDEEKSVADQLPGTATRHSHLRDLASQLLDGGTFTDKASFDKAVARIEEVDPGIVEIIARDLGYYHNFTKKSKQSRDAAVARYALMTSMLDNPDVAIFSRGPHLREESLRIGSQFEEITTARRTADGWSAEFVRVADGSPVRVTKATIEELEEVAQSEEYGYARRERNIIHTPVRTLYADDAQEFISIFNLNREYRKRMQDAVDMTNDTTLVDPLERRKPDGTYMFSEEEGLARRRQEKEDAAQYVAHGRSASVADYALPGQDRKDQQVLADAAIRMERYRAAWLSREQRTEDGRALGYNAVAEDLVNEYGIRGGTNSKFDHEFGIASPLFRNKFVADIRMLPTRTGDIYIPIDHASAQSYGASVLDALLGEAYFRGAKYISKIFPAYFRDFLSKIEAHVDQKIKSAKDDNTKDRWTHFANKYVRGVSSRGRLISPETFNTFVSAFCLYRTEMPSAELMSTLGEFAPELKEIAPVVRDMPEFVSFSAAVDVILGGNGFDFTADNKWDSGLSKYFAVFSPLNAETFVSRVSGSDSAKAETFTAEARRAANNAVAQVLQRPKTQKPRPARPRRVSTPTTETVVPTPSVVPPVVQQIQEVRNAIVEAAESSGQQADVEEVASDVADVAASALGGNTTIGYEVSADLFEGLPAETAEGAEDGDVFDDYIIEEAEEDEEEDSYFTDRKYEAVAYVPPAPYETTEEGDRKVDEARPDTKELTSDEARAFALTVAEVVRSSGATEVTPESLDQLLRSAAPFIGARDRKQVIETFGDALVKDADTDEWVWTVDEDEDGVVLSEFENNNSRTVEILNKSPAIRKMLTIISKVSPSTGRDFQPCIEDLRSFVEYAPVLLQYDLAVEQVHGSLDLAHAVEFLRKILNPRALDYPTANERAAMFDHELSKFSTEFGREEIRRYIKALITPYRSGHPAPSARAAMFLAFLLSIKHGNVRSQLMQLISSSAAAAPVNLKITADNSAEGVSYKLSPYGTQPGVLPLEAITASFAMFEGKPAADLRSAAETLKNRFTENLDKLTPSVTTVNGKRQIQYRPFSTADRTGVMDLYMSTLAEVFGADAPITTACASARLRIALLNGTAMNQSMLASLMSAHYDARSKTYGLPVAASELIEALEKVAAYTEAKAKEGAADAVPADILETSVVGMIRSRAPSKRHINLMGSSLQGMGVWGMVLTAYNAVKPKSVMRAKLDPARTNKPSSSLAITMAGVEPALQLFLDRTDDRGFAKVCERLFPGVSRDVWLRCRGGLRWPNKHRSEIVAKNLNRTAFAVEVLGGARAAFAAELERRGEEAEFSSDAIFYVPLFAGDHSSSIILQVPLTTRLLQMAQEASNVATPEQVTYDDIAIMVNDWLGLDYFGIDAKRSAITSLEAPNVPLFGVELDGFGEPVLDANDQPVHGHVTYGLVWNTNPGANNEAMLGTIQMYGYGAERLRRMALDPNSATLKCHISATSEDPAFGAFPTLTKALTVGFGFGDPERTGKFVGGAERVYQEMMEKYIKDKNSTYILADADSVKLDVINSKVVGVSVNGKDKPLMKYIFEDRVPALREYGVDFTDISGEDLDALIGEIPWVDYTSGSQEPVTKKLSELVPEAHLRQVPGMPEGVYVFERLADHLTAYQVANVSHQAKAAYSQTPRNYMMDALAYVKTLENHNVTIESPTMSKVMQVGLPSTRTQLRDLIANWGLFGATISQDPASVNNLMALDEEWQDALARGELPDGAAADDTCRKIYAAWHRKNFLTLPIKAIQAPLVANIAWIDEETGEVKTHIDDPMFNDTLQGARTIKESKRKFYKAAKRVALCNVNCSEESFRYGMYIDEEALLSHKFLKERGLVVTNGASAEQNVVLTLERAIRFIATGTSTEEDLARVRIALADCLLDHHGVKFSHRRTLKNIKDKKTGKFEARWVRTALSVSYVDLFTKITSQDGGYEFDRSAVYTGMHDSNGDVRMYLGGTKMGLPRTPSLNGSMWNQHVRAALPVTETTSETEIVTNKAKGTKQKTLQWRAGYDAMVAPDPFTLKILGCDHDGDKTAMYMLDTTSGGGLFLPEKSAQMGLFGPAKVKSFTLTDEEMSQLVSDFDNLTDLLADSETPHLLLERVLDDTGAAVEMDYLRRQWMKRGWIAYETAKSKNPDGSISKQRGALMLTREFKTRLNNTFVSLLFDAGAAAVVPEGDNTPLYSGTVVDENNRGRMANGTKASVSSDLATPGKVNVLNEKTSDPAAAWSEVKIQDGVLAPVVLDVASGRTIHNPEVGATVETAAKQVSDARARNVASSGFQHLIYALSLDVVGPLAKLANTSGEDFVDHAYHQDGINNMSFDDMKEQICSRLGIKPWMIDTLVADLIGDLSSGLAVTDIIANQRVATFAKNLHNPEHLYFYLTRSWDPTNYKFRRAARALPQLQWWRSKQEFSFVGDQKDLSAQAQARLKELTQADMQRLWSADQGVAWEDFDDKDHEAILMFLTRSSLPLQEKLDMITTWMYNAATIRDTRNEVSRYNYMKADVGDPYVGGKGAKMFTGPAFRQAVQTGGNAWRMYAATAIAYIGQGTAFESRVSSDTGATDLFGRDDWYSPVFANGTAARSTFITAAIAAPRLNAHADKMQLTSNAHMVGPAVLAFAHPRVVEGSMFNTDAYDKCRALAECIARARRTTDSGVTNFANMTLDFRYAIESMADIVCRIMASSTAASKNQIFNYLSEYADATTYSFNPGVFGQAAVGISRIALGLGDISQKQLDLVHKFWSQIVDGRQLDAEVGRHVKDKPLHQLSNKFKFDFSMDMTVENLKKLLKWASGQQGAFRGDEATADGTVRNVTRDVQTLIKAFELLQKDYKSLFPDGVKIPPSVLFGQLIPIYSAITECTDRTPGPGSRSVMAAIPEEYTRLQTMLRELRRDSYLGSGLALLETINWNPVLAVEKKKKVQSLEAEFFDDDEAPAKESWVEKREREKTLANITRAAQQVAQVPGLPEDFIDKFVNRYGQVAWDERKKMLDAYEVQPMFINARTTLGVFDGLRGLAFKSLVDAVRFGETPAEMGNAKANETSRIAHTTDTLSARRTSADEAYARRVNKPAAPQTAAPQTAAPKPASIDEARTRAVAVRLRALFSQWGDIAVKMVTDKPGEFFILGNMHTAKGTPEERLFKTRINVKLVDYNQLSDANIDSRLKRQSYVESMLAKAGVTTEAFAAMTDEQKRALARQYHTVATTQFDKKPGSFNFKLSDLETLTATMYLDIGHIISDNTDYHEAFHAVMGFVRSVGALSERDIKVLQKKYGSKIVDGINWFDEERAAYDFQRVASNQLTPELVQQSETKSVLQKLAQFFAALFEALKNAILAPDYWRPESYSRDMSTNPLMHIMLTGHVHSMEDEEATATVTTDRKGLLARALQYMDEYVRKYNADLMTDPTAAEETYRNLPSTDTLTFVAMARLNAKKSNPDADDLDAIWINALPDEAWGSDAVTELLEKFADRPVNDFGAGALKADFGVDDTPFIDNTPFEAKVQNPTVNDPSLASAIDQGGFQVDFDFDALPAEAATEEPDEFDAVARVTPYFREKTAALRRFPVAYSEHDTLARSLAVIVREAHLPRAERSPEFDAATQMVIKRTSPYNKRNTTDQMIAKMRGAISRMADVFGIDPTTFSAKQEEFLFRGLCQLNTNIENAHDVTRAETINLRRKEGKPENVRPRSEVSAAVLASNMAVAAGLSAGDILNAALSDLHAIVDRRNPNDGFVEKVLNQHLIPLLNNLLVETEDPTQLLERFNEDDSFDPTFAAVLSGLMSEKTSDGYHYQFRLASEHSDNPYYESNVARYANYVSDPDFQIAISRVSDALYMLAASRNLYRDFGFLPGKMSDLDVIGKRRESKTPVEMALDLDAHPDQYADDAFEAVSFFDQPWFMTANPKMWLDSMLNPSFGKIDFRTMAQGVNRDTQGYQNRIVNIRNIHAFEYGLSDLAGTKLVAVDENYDSKLEWKAGEIVHGQRKTPDTVRRYLNYTGQYTKYSLTLNEQRLIDLVLKARRVYMTGGRKMITGVDGLTISVGDSYDESYYSREKVAQRVKAGRAHGMSDIDKVLNRLDRQLHDDQHGDHFEFITEGGSGNYDFRAQFIKALCESIKKHAARPPYGRSFNDVVLEDLARSGFVNNVTRTDTDKNGNRVTRNVSGALSLDVDRIEELFLQSSAYKTLLKAGRKAEWLARDAYIKPYRDLWVEVRNFVRKHPFLSEGDGRFFHMVNSPLPFVRGSGVFMHNAMVVEDRTRQEKLEEVLPKFMEAFPTLGVKGMDISLMDDNLFGLLRTLHLVEEHTLSDFIYQLGQGKYADKPGVLLTSESSTQDAAEAVYRTLTEMVWAGATNDEFKDLGGRDAVIDALEAYRERRFDDMTSIVSGGSAGMTDELVHSITGVLPASHELGHAMQNAIEGIMTALAYRATLINMITAPAEDGTPVCYVKPTLNAAVTAGIPDEVWGTIGRWYASIHQLEYDDAKTGIENVRRLYDAITGAKSFRKNLYGSINPEEMDTRSIEGFMARKGTPDGESKLANMAGGYALGYAKHLFQSTKGLGGKYQRAIIHRALAYSKSLSVSFSFFFPIATRFESPVGAVGALAALGGNISSEGMRKMAATMENVRQALNGKTASPDDGIVKKAGKAALKVVTGEALTPEWITRNFTGNSDYVKLLESNDPFLADMYQFASAIGLGMSTSNKNAFEHSRGVMLEDLNRLTGFVSRKLGLKAARNLKRVTSALFEESSERAFSYHMNATKLAVAAQICAKLQHEARKKGIAFDPVRDLRRYSQYINAEVGGIDPLASAWHHPKMKALMNVLFFSFDWTLGAWVAAGGPILTRLFTGGHTITPEETKYMFGRAIRMGGWVAYGLPIIVQALAKALGMAIDPDHEDREDEPWWTWENEEKARWKAFDLTPLLRAVGKRFPKYEEFRRNHPVAAMLPVAAFPFLGSKRLPGGSMPRLRSNVLRTAAVATSFPALPADVDKHNHVYMHFAKQWWEIGGWFDDPVKAAFGKSSMILQKIFEGVLGRSLTSMGHAMPWDEMGAIERWVYPTRDSALFNLAGAFLPFSFSGLGNAATQGIFPILAPVGTGASKYATIKGLEKEFTDWVMNDRAGYAFAGKKHKNMRAFTKDAMRRNVTVRSLLNTAVKNGHVSEADAFRLVNLAIQKFVNKQYKEFIAAFPEHPGDDFDTTELKKILRRLQRCGKAGKDLREALVKRLKEQHKWQRISDEQKEAFNLLLKDMRVNPYSSSNLDTDY